MAVNCHAPGFLLQLSQVYEFFRPLARREFDVTPKSSLQADASGEGTG